jgi:hypothetical protein
MILQSISAKNMGEMDNMQTSAKPPSARQTAKQQLFTSLYGHFHQYVYDCQPSLLFGDADTILMLLADELPSYRGKLTAEALTKWAFPQIERHAERFAIANRITKAYSNTIFYAIRDGMSCFAKDSAVDYDDLKQEINLLILRYALSLSKPGTASLKTRLNALISRHCWGYHIRDRKNRLRIVTDFNTTLARRGAEVMSEAELVSNRWDEDEPDYCGAPVAA